MVPADEVPRFDREEGGEDVTVEIKNLLIDDDPTEDILVHLQDACDWIQDGLNQNSMDNLDCQNGVLVHCSQGISRSGSFIVAFRKSQHPCHWNPFAYHEDQSFSEDRYFMAS